MNGCSATYFAGDLDGTTNNLRSGFRHIGAIRVAQDQRVHQGCATFDMTALPIMSNERYRPFQAIVEGRLNIIKTSSSTLPQWSKKNRPDFVFGSLWGNQHFILSTAKSPKSFDFILPDEPTRDRVADAQLIPFEMIKSHIHTFPRRRFSPANIEIVDIGANSLPRTAAGRGVFCYSRRQF